jgi:hypothetical protein
MMTATILAAVSGAARIYSGGSQTLHTIRGRRWDWLYYCPACLPGLADFLPPALPY